MRRWIKNTIVCLFLLAAAMLLGEDAVSPGTFVLARLKYAGGSDWYNGPSELPNLANFVREKTGIDVIDRGDYVQIMDDDLFNYPFLYLTGHGNISLSPEEVKRLRIYLTNGGFLFANDDYGLDKAFRREIKKVFPDSKLVELPFNHPIYHCFFNFSSGLPKIHKHNGKPPRGFGIYAGGRLCVFYDYESDIGDGWDDPSVHNDPPDKREAALKMGTNIIIYAMTH